MALGTSGFGARCSRVWEYLVVSGLLLSLASCASAGPRGRVEQSRMQVPQIAAVGTAYSDETGATFVSIQTLSGQVILWELSDSRARVVGNLGRLRDGDLELPAPVSHVALSPGGNYALCVRSGSSNGTFTYEGSAPDVQLRVQQSPDGADRWGQWLEVYRLPRSGTTEQMRLSSVASTEWTSPLPGLVLAAAITDDAGFIATSDLRGQVIVWRRVGAEGRYRPLVSLPAGLVQFMWFTEGRRPDLVGVSADGLVFRVRVRSKGDSSQQACDRTGVRVLRAAFDRTSRTLAVLTADGRLAAYHVPEDGGRAAQPIWSRPVPVGTRLSAGHGVIATVDQGSLVSYKANSGEIVLKRQLPAPGQGDTPAARLPVAARDGAVWVVEDLGSAAVLRNERDRIVGRVALEAWFARRLRWLAGDRWLCAFEVDPPGVSLFEKDGARMRWLASLTLPTRVWSVGGSRLALLGLGSPVIDLRSGKLYRLSSGCEFSVVDLSPSGNLAVRRPGWRVEKENGTLRIDAPESDAAEVLDVTTKGVVDTIRLEQAGEFRGLAWETDELLVVLWRDPSRPGVRLVGRVPIGTDERLRPRTAEIELPEQDLFYLGHNLCPGYGGNLGAVLRDGQEVVLYRWSPSGTLEKVARRTARDLLRAAFARVGGGRGLSGVFRRSDATILSLALARRSPLGVADVRCEADQRSWLCIFGSHLQPVTCVAAPGLVLCLEPAITARGSGVAYTVSRPTETSPRVELLYVDLTDLKVPSSGQNDSRGKPGSTHPADGSAPARPR